MLGGPELSRAQLRVSAEALKLMLLPAANARVNKNISIFLDFSAVFLDIISHSRKYYFNF